MLELGLESGLLFLLDAQMKGVTLEGVLSELDMGKDQAQTVPVLLEKERLGSRVAAKAEMLVVGSL